MQRDWDLIRRILLTIEAAPAAAKLTPDGFEEPNKTVLFEHVKLLSQASLIDARLLADSTGAGGGMFLIHGLTWEGHDLLAKIKAEGAWEKIKNLAKEKGIELSVEAIKATAKIVLSNMLGGG